MNQLMLDIPTYGPWMRVPKADRSCRLLADRHYSRQKIGTSQFTRPGQNLVLRTPLGDAVWVTWSGIRDDGWDAWECTIFRNEAPDRYRSSEMIQAAVEATLTEWGPLPNDGLITYVAANKIRSVNPGFCFKKAGFKRIGRSKHRGLILLQYKPLPKAPGTTEDA